MPAGDRSEADAVQTDNPTLLSVCRRQHGPGAGAAERTQRCELLHADTMMTINILLLQRC